MTESTPPKKIAVIGGGISGLAAAHRLIELAPDTNLTLFEASDRLGGAIRTTHRDGFLLDRGPDNFITQLPWGTSLCKRLGIDGELLSTDPARRKAFVVRKGRLLEIPEGFVLMAPSRVWPVISTRILTLRGKLRMAGEYFLKPKKDGGDESFASFVSRRLGREVFDRLVQPLISSIYTADATKLSIDATMPQFVKMEREHGGLIRGARKMAAARKAAAKGASGARYSMFTTPEGGMVRFVEAISERLPDGAVRLGADVASVQASQSGEGWDVVLADGSRETFDGVIIATPGHKTQSIIADVDTDVAEELAGVPYATSAVVSLGYRRDQIGHPLDGFGYVVPLIEGRKTLAGSFSSVKYTGRAPDGCELLRVFVGGAVQGEVAKLPDDELKKLIHEELCELLHVTGEPLLAEITRWPSAMPQYQVGHVERVARIEGRMTSLPGLELAGNAYHGVGVPQCIHTGEQAAERMLGEGGAKGQRD